MTDPLRSGYRAEQTPDCSSHVTTVVADVALAALFIAGTGLTLFQMRTDEDADVGGDDVGRSAALAASFAASAYYGVRQHHRCDAAYAAHDRWVTERGVPPRIEQRP